ncbi:MAG: hypothetical protein ABIO86_22225 [Sphingomonas sp.]
MKKARALLFIASLALMAGALVYKVNRWNRDTRTADAVSRFMIAGTEENGNKRLFMEIGNQFIIKHPGFPDTLGYIKVNYRNMKPSPGGESATGDNVLVSVIARQPDFLSGLMKSKADGNWIDPMYGNVSFPDTGEIRFGLSYRPQRVPGRPEELWQRIYSKTGSGRNDFVIKCIPPISINSISEPKSCEMTFNLPIAANLSKSLSIVVDVDFDVDRLSDWKNIEKSISSFVGSRIVYDAVATK